MENQTVFNVMEEFVGKKQRYPLMAVKACSIKTYKLTGKICIFSLDRSKDLIKLTDKICIFSSNCSKGLL